ncbi:Ionotropic receptor 184 [Hyalella azteca]|uniref:Ionotropic receptor 184 n=1 Tax=Hyalella azteca TaxID=294128 RepID=A0A6A0H1Q8_HYAAZ|nr:Ionotropic receptor 184 [Hyalella azteca]
MTWLGSAHDVASVLCSLASVLAAHRIDLLSLPHSSGLRNGPLPTSSDALHHAVSRMCFSRNIRVMELIPGKNSGNMSMRLSVSITDSLEDLIGLKQSMQEAGWSSRSWQLLIAPHTVFQTAVSVLPLPLDNKILFLVPEDIGFSAWEAYRASAAVPAVYQYLTAVSVPPLREQLDVLRREPWSRRTNLTGLVVRCSILEYEPYTIITEEPFEVSGFLIDLWKMIQYHFGFDLVCRKPKDGLWGNLDVASSTWSGVLGELQRAEADISIAPFGYNEERGRFFHFSAPILFTKAVVLHKAPSPLAEESNYTKQFTTWSWTATAFTFMVSVLVMKLTNSRHSSWSDCIFRNFRIFCNMGDEGYTPDRLGLRIWLITKLMTVILLHVFYTAFIIAALSSNDAKLPVKDLNDVYERRGEYTLGLIKDSFMIEEFKFARDPLFARLWRDVISKDPLGIATDEDHSTRTLSTSKHVYLNDYNYYISSRKNCGLTMLPTSYFKRGSYIPIRRGFSAYNVINHALLKVNEAGIIERMWRRWSNLSDQPCSSSSPAPLGVRETRTGFMPLVAGALVAAFLLLVEWLSTTTFFMYLKRRYQI